MTDKTVAQHLSDSAALAQTISDANALVVKLQKQLHEDRAVIELLGQWSHPKLSIGPIYGTWVPNDAKSLTGEQISKLATKRINDLLGDRA